MSTARVILGDCLAVLPGIESGSVDVCITDPPYNVGIEYGDCNDRRTDYLEWCRAWFAELVRVCKGPIAITCGQANIGVWAVIRPPTWWLAWWKPAAMGRCVVGFNNWEPIALYGKPTKAVCDVIRAPIKPDADCDGHPCPKPLGWASGQIKMLSEEGQTVLDPFAGSGTTAVASLRTGRNFIGVEQNAHYVAIAEKRIAEEQSRYPLFTDTVAPGNPC